MRNNSCILHYYLKASGSPSIVTNLFSQWYGPTNYNDSVNIDPFIYSEYKLEEANYIDTNKLLCHLIIFFQLFSY